MIKALLFDFDGVIADTPRWHVTAWKKVLARYDITIKPEDVYLHEGRPAQEIAQQLFRQAGRELSSINASALAREKNNLFRAYKAQLARGAIQILRMLRRKKVKTGLVTGTVKKNVDVVLGEKILSLFDVVITEKDVQRGKPSPDPYLLAAQKLNITPEECLVIENAPAGIEAAKAARMKCIALSTTLSPQYLEKADYLYSDLFSLKNDLERIQQGI